MILYDEKIQLCFEIFGLSGKIFEDLKENLFFFDIGNVSSVKIV